MNLIRILFLWNVIGIQHRNIVSHTFALFSNKKGNESYLARTSIVLDATHCLRHVLFVNTLRTISKVIKVKIIIRKESENVLIRPIMKKRRKILMMKIIMISKIMNVVYD